MQHNRADADPTVKTITELPGDFDNFVPLIDPQRHADEIQMHGSVAPMK
jgi:hypothetical protein